MIWEWVKDLFMDSLPWIIIIVLIYLGFKGGLLNFIL